MLLLFTNYVRSQESCNCGGTGIAYTIAGNDELCEYAEPREMTVEKPAAYDDQLFIISPNPAREYVQIRHTGSGTENWKMEITDAFGRVVDTRQFGEMETAWELSTKEYAPGLYFLHFQAESGLHAVKKLIVSR